MIIDKEITIKVNPAQLKHFKSIGMNVSHGETITIKPSQLNSGSNVKIKCSCDVCGEIKEKPYRRYLRSIDNGGYYACSPKCAQNKVKNTFLEKYGHEHHFQSKETKEKIKETWLETYGVEHFSHSEKYKKQSKNIVNKRKETINTQYIESDNLIDINGDFFIKKCDICDKIYEINKRLYHNRKCTNTNTCTLCFPLNENVSIKEKEVFKFIDNLIDGVVPNHKIDGKEIDIYVPSLNIGIEFNGLYWHNELHKHNNYHLEKTELMCGNGIRLIHIFEDDWIYKRDIVESRLLNLFGKSNKIYARKCEIREIIPKESKEFLNKNHIQGSVNTKIKVGLYYGDELVSVMTFGKLRKSLGSKHVDGQWELIRFCNKLNTTVIGGASKLFKYFIKNYNPEKIISYADRSWSNGSLYYNLGFELSHKTKPNYYYINGNKRLNRYNFRKDELVSEGFDPNKTEHQIMLDRKIYRIYDSGSLVFTYQNRS